MNPTLLPKYKIKSRSNGWVITIRYVSNTEHLMTAEQITSTVLNSVRTTNTARHVLYETH